ncbi:GNAT family N-acetyltransferase [Pseudonocardia sp. N23]|uniref:GNAT family N-acetyltransferase n=1 Tax=Pseudonocardia sp. N23 TaxID=1987376 RepID=UPI000C031EFF|nr:GNAT family protein [Pseudonocardia sp. N23]GAY13098.1 acetyltransferase [Pseudonocardia sp. N23]
MDLRDVPRLDADGCVLRAFRGDDLPLVLEAARDGAITRVTTVPQCADEYRARTWIRMQQARVADRAGFPFAIADAVTDEPLGQVGLWFSGVGAGRARVGYWVPAAHRGRGLAGRALRRLVPWAFEVAGVERLELYVEPHNVASQRVATGAGFRWEGLLRAWETIGAERRDMVMYSRLPSDPEARCATPPASTAGAPSPAPVQ